MLGIPISIGIMVFILQANMKGISLTEIWLVILYGYRIPSISSVQALSALLSLFLSPYKMI